MDRRAFLGLTAAVGSSMLSGCSVRLRRLSLAAPVRPIGLQLYTVMDLLDRDFEGTLRTVAKIGYKEVETLGDFSQDRARFRQLLEDCGLTSPSQHIMPAGLGRIFAAGVRNEISKQELENAFLKAFSFERIDALIAECIEQAHGLGQQYIIWQITWPSQLKAIADIDRLIRTLNKAGRLCSEAGLRFAYHNHGAEFVPVGGDVPYELILNNTDPAHVHFELDLAWATFSGGDPIPYLERHPGRFHLCHLKDVDRAGNVCATGEGIVRFPAFLQAAARAGIAHYFVEYDAPADPLREITNSYARLAPLM
ncbi:MAG: sugar phosphate isomerase/epimerase [Pseudomonas sp.]